MASILGEHLARATGYEVGEVSNGNTQLGVSLRIEVGDFEGIEKPFYMHFNNDDNVRRSLVQLRAMGVRGTDAQILADLEGDVPKLDGFGSKRVQITIGEEKDLKGEFIQRIIWVGGGIPLGKRLTNKEGFRRIAEAIRKLGTNGSVTKET